MRVGVDGGGRRLNGARTSCSFDMGGFRRGCLLARLDKDEVLTGCEPWMMTIMMMMMIGREFSSRGCWLLVGPSERHDVRAATPRSPLAIRSCFLCSTHHQSRWEPLTYILLQYIHIYTHIYIYALIIICLFPCVRQLLRTAGQTSTAQYSIGIHFWQEIGKPKPHSYRYTTPSRRLSP